MIAPEMIVLYGAGIAVMNPGAAAAIALRAMVNQLGTFVKPG